MYTFIATCILLMLCALAWIARALLGAAKTPEANDPSLAVYRDQLREVERDLARGVLSAEDAERTRTEVARKLLAADTQGAQVLRPSGRAGLGLGIAVAIILAVAAVTYWQIGAPGYPDVPLAQRLAAAEAARANRPGQAEAEAQAAALMAPPPPVAAEAAELLGQLREILKTRPDDLRGHRLLARNEGALGNFSAAWQAQARVIAIQGPENAPAEDHATLAELMVLAAGGYVSPQAEAALRQALTLDPGNGTARYYMGLMYAQGGRPDLALPVWKRLVGDSQPDDPWLAPIYDQIEEVSRLAGDPTPLDALPQPGSGRGPTAADIDAAQGMSMDERMEMIEGMVSGLAERLSTEGGPPQDWGRLITSLGVLGNRAAAAQVWEEAKIVFAGDQGALDLLAKAADRAGVNPE